MGLGLGLGLGLGADEAHHSLPKLALLPPSDLLPSLPLSRLDLVRVRVGVRVRVRVGARVGVRVGARARARVRR